MKAKGFVKCFFSRHCIIDKSENILNGIIRDERNFLCKCKRCGLYVMHDGSISGLTCRFMSERKALCIKRELESFSEQLKNIGSRTMTREEAIKMLKSKMDGHTDTSYEWAETVRMAIEALKKEPSEDCIDRYSALAEVDPSSYDYKAIKELPSVVSSTEPKRGKWEYKEIANSSIVGYWCNQCHIGTSKAYDFCPHCGARMESDEE